MFTLHPETAKYKTPQILAISDAKTPCQNFVRRQQQKLRKLSKLLTKKRTMAMAVAHLKTTTKLCEDTRPRKVKISKF
jgi:hypothetical protein